MRVFTGDKFSDDTKCPWRWVTLKDSEKEKVGPGGGRFEAEEIG